MEKAGVKGFSESNIGSTQRTVLNNSGRAVLFGEFVSLGGFFGNVAKNPQIANGERGNIDINFWRTVRTTQIKAGVTFAIDDTVYFEKQTSSAAGAFSKTAAGNTLAGKVTAVDNGTGGTSEKWIEIQMIAVPYTAGA